jgi:putative FmdB family regulatory protein
MPIFEYVCYNCGEVKEKLVKQSEVATAPPPQCKICVCDMQKRLSATNNKIHGAGAYKPAKSIFD